MIANQGVAASMRYRSKSYILDMYSKSSRDLRYQHILQSKAGDSGVNKHFVVRLSFSYEGWECSSEYRLLIIVFPSTYTPSFPAQYIVSACILARLHDYYKDYMVHLNVTVITQFPDIRAEVHRI